MGVATLTVFKNFVKFLRRKLTQWIKTSNKKIQLITNIFYF